jgi:hypothetical protein
MKAKKKKPSKRGTQAKKRSLHCSQKIVKPEKKIKKWVTKVSDLYSILSSLTGIVTLVKYLTISIIHLIQYLQSTL